jgi:beta-phosphoglucomutase-like phosphatase (HAD superfamily)
VWNVARRTSFLFDLDGTLGESVYQHELAWREALAAEGIDLSVSRIHRKIGMSSGLFSSMLLRETGYHINAERIDRLRRLHAAAFHRTGQDTQPPAGRTLGAVIPISSIRDRQHSHCRFRVSNFAQTPPSERA